MCLAIWYILVFVLKKYKIKGVWVKLFTAFTLAAVTSFLFYYCSPFEDYPLHPLGKMPFVEAAGVLLVRGVLIAVIFYPFASYLSESYKFQKKSLELEQLKRMDLQMQLTLLQEQMDPHFLFNALNVLKSGTQDKWVKDFVLQLANAYRYLLDHKIDEHIVPVPSELKFIHSYIYVLEARFGEGLNIDIQPEILESKGRIPPMALQTLIENAVKHNIITRAKKLNISIFCENELLVVRNNIQKKRSSSVDSKGIGLSNLRARYRLISNQDILIEEEEDYFTVKIPILA
jgi:LytS/YehU family sensor histidine kinase